MLCPFFFDVFFPLFHCGSESHKLVGGDSRVSAVGKERRMHVNLLGSIGKGMREGTKGPACQGRRHTTRKISLQPAAITRLQP